MAQYKVPQDVEADDKLLGPFTFRQIIYLFVAAGLIGLAVALFQLFPLLAIIPVPFIIFFGALALPLKKDQPMETYLSALVSYYLKPNKRFWNPGQRESTILITAPKIVEQPRSRDITGSEASHRLSFLANVIDTEGQAIKDFSGAPIKEEFIAEANAAQDIFDSYRSENLNRIINTEAAEHHAEVVDQMRAAIKNAETIPTMPTTGGPTIIQKHSDHIAINHRNSQQASVVVQPGMPATPTPAPQPSNPAMVNLANNNDFSVQTIAKEANRINNLDSKETYISLH